MREVCRLAAMIMVKYCIKRLIISMLPKTEYEEDIICFFVCKIEILLTHSVANKVHAWYCIEVVEIDKSREGNNVTRSLSLQGLTISNNQLLFKDEM